MSGGPSQTDTFDMKPGHENGGEFKEIATNVPGVRFSELLPRLAQHADKLAIIRSLSTKEGDHERGSYLMRTGQRPMSVISYPSVAAALAKQMATADDSLPPYVSVAPSRRSSQVCAAGDKNTVSSASTSEPRPSPGTPSRSGAM